MTLPFFYKDDLTASSNEVVLDEATSKHVVQVLRMQNGEQLQITNGKGILITAEITDNNRKRCTVSVVNKSEIANPKSEITIAVSPVKSNARFEWLLEKATEIGVSEIIPLMCTRTERSNFKFERLNNIIISAMLQSQQCWLPVLHQPAKFSELVGAADHDQKFIAHCLEEKKRKLTDLNNESLSSKIILIGPEGDFTPEEIDHALENHFSAVSLGDTRLRTETAGMVAATLLCLV